MSESLNPSFVNSASYSNVPKIGIGHNYFLLWFEKAARKFVTPLNLPLIEEAGGSWVSRTLSLFCTAFQSSWVPIWTQLR